MKLHYIIAFSGKARVGKNTAAMTVRAILLGKTQFQVREKSFAAKLKDIAQDLFHWDGDKDLYSAGDKGRNLLINIGNKMREIRSSVWVDYIIEDMRQEVYDDPFGMRHLFLITDLRYQNEAERLLKAQNFIPEVRTILIRLERPGCLHLDHISETDLDKYNKFKYTITTGDNDLRSLENQLKEILLKEGVLDVIHSTEVET